MSLESVTEYFRHFGIETRIVTLTNSTATVAEAAKEHKVLPGQIGKTLSFKIKETPILILVSGNMKIDNKKYRMYFGTKAKMLAPEEALLHTGHEIGGICPFGFKKTIDVFLDISLKNYSEIIPAAGDKNSAIKLTLEEIEKYSAYKAWVDVCKRM